MPNTPPNLVAGGNIYPCRFCTLSTSYDMTVVQCGANEDVIGVSQEGTNSPPLSDVTVSTYAAADGQNMRMFGEGDVCLIEAGDVITRGGRLKSDSVGRAVPIATTGTTRQKIGAIALQSAAAAGNKILCQVRFETDRPALT
jgi:hypothetical protein